jgi:predicted GNAT family acetyltransferase
VIAENTDGYQVRAEGIDGDLVHRWISTDSYWAAGRSAEKMARALANSLSFGVFDPSGTLVGIARAVTDHATFGWIADVYIDRGHRGRGLGTWLVGELTRELLDEGIPRVVLATRDAHGVYEKIGFRPLAAPERWMEIDRR